MFGVSEFEDGRYINDIVASVIDDYTKMYNHDVKTSLEVSHSKKEEEYNKYNNEYQTYDNYINPTTGGKKRRKTKKKRKSKKKRKRKTTKN